MQADAAVARAVARARRAAEMEKTFRARLRRTEKLNGVRKKSIKSAWLARQTLRSMRLSVRPLERDPILALPRKLVALDDRDAVTAELVATAQHSVPLVQCGVYFVMRSGRCVYVGQSVNIYARLSSHSFLGNLDAVSYLPCAKEDLCWLERHFIDLLLPDMNKDGRTRRIKKRRDEATQLENRPT